MADPVSGDVSRLVIGAASDEKAELDVVGFVACGEDDEVLVATEYAVIEQDVGASAGGINGGNVSGAINGERDGSAFRAGAAVGILEIDVVRAVTQSVENDVTVRAAGAGSVGV